MQTRSATKKPLFATLVISVALHVVAFAVMRFSDDAPEQNEIPPVVLEIQSITETAEPAQPVQNVTQQRRAGVRSDVPRPVQTAALAASIEQPATMTLLADLKVGMRSVTALKGAAAAVDESEIRFESPHTADAILAAPYPFPRVGGTRLGVAGGGNCPAGPAQFP